jgi:hypothetical protein
MTHSTTLLQNFAQRDAHRLAQKVSLIVMASLVLACQSAQGIVDIAMPDEVMMAIVVGVIAYLIGNRAAHSLISADHHSEEDFYHLFAVDSQ